MSQVAGRSEVLPCVGITLYGLHCRLLYNKLHLRVLHHKYRKGQVYNHWWNWNKH